MLPFVELLQRSYFVSSLMSERLPKLFSINLDEVKKKKKKKIPKKINFERYFQKSKFSSTKYEIN